MKKIVFAAALALAAPLAIPAAATAGTFLTSGATGEIASPGSKSYNFNATATTGTIMFNLLGYGTLDGVNCCTDTLTVDLNGTTILQMAYNLGGAGDNVVYVGSPTITNYTSGSPSLYNGTALGGSLDAMLGATFLAGSNTLTFTYSGTAQGLGDEAWGLDRVTAGAVPEPATWAMLITGFGMVGFAARRRSAAIAA